LARNPTYHSKIKHIPVKYLFVREVIDESGVVALKKVLTKKSCAEMFTKLVISEKLK